jgi:hypothetical protein
LRQILTDTQNNNQKSKKSERSLAVSEQDINPAIGEAFWRAIIVAELLAEKGKLQLGEEGNLAFERAITVVRGRK